MILAGRRVAVFGRPTIMNLRKRGNITYTSKNEVVIV